MIKKNISFQEQETNWNFTGCQMPHTIYEFIKPFNKMSFLRNIEPLSSDLWDILEECFKFLYADIFISV